MSDMLIMVDVDGVVADLHSVWYKLYNEEYGDDLTHERVTDWEVHKFVKPECGKHIYTYLDIPGLYDEVKPIDGALTGVQYIRNLGHRVVFATSGLSQAYAKYLWLESKGFEPGNWGSDFVSVHDKSLLKGNLLVDDAFHNVQAFSSRTSILFTYPHNANAAWYGHRAKNWHEVTQIINSYR
jgi:5'-nucleotidase